MCPSDPTPPDPADPRAMSGAIWAELCSSLEQAGRFALGEGVPDAPADRAEGLRYLTRFLAAGIVSCVAHDDPDHPVLGRAMDVTMPWGLDNPDCLYLHAALRGDAVYRLHGWLGTANHVDIQVNFGHFANGDISSWGTVDSLSGRELELDADGRFELVIGGERRGANWLRLAPDAEFLFVRQYFNDWENERPADLLLERVGAVHPQPRVRTDQIVARLDKLRRWLDRGGALWEQMSRGLLSMEPNTLVVHLPESSGERAGLKGQAYGMGNFHCEPDEAVVVEFTPPPCRHWSVALANYYWESIDFAERQSSLNGHQAALDPDGVFRAVIAHADPGVRNWLDPGGHARGTLAARFLEAETAPAPRLRRLPLGDLAGALPHAPRVDAAERGALLERRRRAALRRYRR